ncbi:N-acetylglucosamine-6-phosphate deacetylase [Microbacterium sp. MYb62]|uniref:N-acetylglucosamine-6-phosphate deacetylase n=1 Tax=Microbacterium sp. MYb62 TaxID=1848690 RepID=UPI000CFB228A|nr:N-acetylglucosamine-6-phosphate deacetylase [Microbacterium sp. MYb62]PRB18270.1 N-acetylglucosamine-6-phosphate deacetylase [Microbacterium sp. MYb62]
MSVIRARHVVTPDGIVDGWLRTDGGAIVEIGRGDPPSGPALVDAGDGWVVPGFVDLHCHGGDGASLYSGTREDVAVVARGHLAAGTTSMFASIATMPPEAMLRAADDILAVVRAGEAPNIVGVHFEGPFLSARRRGAQQESALQLPSAELLDELLERVGGLPVIMTIAPELPRATELIATYADRVIFALGHSDATFDEGVAGIDAGARLVTHAFNAMPPLDHRHPGLVGAALTDPRVRIELIADGHHLHDTVLSFAVSAVGPSRGILVTDASAAAGLSDGDHDFPDRLVTVRDGRVSLRGTPTLAGSTLRLAAAHARMIRLGTSAEDAVRLSSTNASALVGLADRGALRVGARADVVALDPELRVTAVVHGGRLLSTVG